jgi:preprotein translocase subunit SecE
MARLQRKKASTAKKKKKKSGAKTASLQMKNGAVAKKTDGLKGPVKDVKKRQSLPQTKALTRARTEPGKIKSYIDKGLQFLREVKVELKKVAWPTRKQTMGSTAVVLVLVMIISLFLGVVDIGLSSLIRLVFK